MSSITQALKDEVHLSDPSCYTDSTVALYWILGEEKAWKPFVQNRVNEIRALLPPNQWTHCPGKENPADLPSRGLTIQELKESSLWWEGPSWLKDKVNDFSVVTMPETQQDRDHTWAAHSYQSSKH